MKKVSKQNYLQQTILFLLLAFFSFPYAHAATLSIDPNGGEYGPGDTFVANIRLNPINIDECINVIDLNLKYPKERIMATAVSKGESILTIWADEPVIDQAKGEVSLSGGIPGGYCGRVLGDPGETNIVAKIIFSVPTPNAQASTTVNVGKISVAFSSSTQALLNDGAGTPATLNLVGAEFNIIPQSKNLRNEWTEEMRGDVIPPDEFTAEIVKDQNAYSGKYFIVFSTVDKQSGLSHFEVMEEDPSRPGRLIDRKDAALFVPASSPFVLKDQSLRSKITVRAYDNAGNVRDTVILPRNSLSQTAQTVEVEAWLPWVVFSLLFLFTVGYALFMFRKKSPTEFEQIDDQV